MTTSYRLPITTVTKMATISTMAATTTSRAIVEVPAGEGTAQLAHVRETHPVPSKFARIAYVLENETVWRFIDTDLIPGDVPRRFNSGDYLSDWLADRVRDIHGYRAQAMDHTVEFEFATDREDTLRFYRLNVLGIDSE